MTIMDKNVTYVKYKQKQTKTVGDGEYQSSPSKQAPHVPSKVTSQHQRETESSLLSPTSEEVPHLHISSSKFRTVTKTKGSSQ